MDRFLPLFLSVSILVVISCQQENPVTPAPEEKKHVVEQSFPIVYQAQIPEGKLPHPHHDPSISQQAADVLIEDLWIINNYGQYQSGDESPEQSYFHDGLDIVLPNGTPIFALDAGIVRANVGGDQYYRSLAIEDLDNPRKAWFYTHVYDFVVAPGDTVVQGQFLGVVNFKGIEHIHLTRGYLQEGGSWNRFSDWVSTYPADHFVLRDESPPIIETPFLFFKNLSNDRFEHGTVDTISGEVDLVVGMRDAGQYAGGWLEGGSGYYGDRLCVKRVDYRILKDGVEIFAQHSFDFSQLEFQYHNGRWREALNTFKYHKEVDYEPGNWNRFLSHYILTNSNPDDPTKVRGTDDKRSWDTQMLGEDGHPMFPNGHYLIEVTAYDVNENVTVAQDSVYIKN